MSLMKIKIKLMIYHNNMDKEKMPNSNRRGKRTIAKEKLYEVNIKEDIYTEEDATIKAIEISKQKLLENNSKISEITETIVLNKENLGSKIKLNLFISVLEDITKIIEITEEIPQTNE